MAAVIVEGGVDEGLCWHLGSPVAEARRIADGRGVLPLTNREVLEIVGEDRLQFLHLISSQQFEGLAAGEAVEALILDAQGHVQHAFTGVDDGARLLAWTEPGRADALVAHLMRMRFAMRVEARRLDGAAVCWAGEKERLDGVRVACPFGGVFVVTTSTPEATVGTWALEARRIEAGVPRVFVDTDEKTIPNEIGLWGTALGKGCYPGQETVAKVHTLGRPPRRLVRLHLDGSLASLPALGAPLRLGEKVVGRVGSSALHHELGPIALALVKRGVAVAAELSADGIAAAQEVIVDPDVGLHVRPRLQ